MADITFTPEPGSISPPLDLLTKDINPQAREILDARSPMSQFREVEPNLVDAGGAKQIDMNARARLGGFRSPMSQFQEAAPRTLPGFKEADDLDVKTVEELDANRDGFRPAEYFSANPDVANDPKKLAKLLEVVRRRDKEGLIASRVASAAVKNTPGLVSDIAGGVKRLGERAIDVVVQPTANVVLGALTGDLFDDQKRAALFNETRKTIKKGTAEVGAGSEAATVGLVDLARTADQKISRGAITSFDDLPRTRVSRPETIPAKPKTDQELLAQLSDDASFRQVADAAIKGEGEAAKNFGLDKETLAAQGITLDEKAIQQLSLVDPITMVATGGAFKLVGIGGKVLGTARTLEGAQHLADGFAKVAKFTAGKGIQYAGAATKKAGEVLQGSGRTASLITGVGAATRGAGPIEALAIAGATKIVGPTVRKVGALAEHFGKSITGEVPVSVAGQKLLDYVKPVGSAAGTVLKGAVEGLVAGSPFALAAQDDETAGSLLGAGAALGAAGGAGAGAFRVVKSSASRRYFGENRPVLPDVPSQAYGFDAALDAQHEANIQKLSAQDASELNNFREALRQQGGEIYAVDQPTFRQKVAEEYRARTGQEIDPALLTTYENHSAFFDTTQGDRKVVYLNSDTKGLQHDAGHIFDAVLSPEKRAELRTAVEQAFTPEQRQAFRDTYERRVGSKISDTAAVDEFIAEQFAALFNNVPVTELNAPKSLLNKFVDIAAEGAEALGIDLSAGATTPNLGAPVSVGIRQLFRNAAGDVTKANIGGVPPIKVDFRGGNTPPPSGGGPAPRPPVSPVAPVSPVGETSPAAPSGSGSVTSPTGQNLRATPPEVLKFQAPTPVQTPGAREAAAARFAETGIDIARAEAKKNDGSPNSQIIERISDAMESGSPVVQIEHLGFTSKSKPKATIGNKPRRKEREAGQVKLAKLNLTERRAEAPADIISKHGKTFVPYKWEKDGNTLKLTAMSLDKIIENIKTLSEAASDPKFAELIPYPVENGRITDEGWRQIVADNQAYSENQAKGRMGGGNTLNVPEIGLSVPAQNPSYTPKMISPERANFQNLLQGLDVPSTGSSPLEIPANAKGQIFAEANLRPTETPVNIPAKKLAKQGFKNPAFAGRTVQEVNPLRNRMKEAGFDFDTLSKVTEVINARDITSAVPRPDINYKAPVTDIIRGGFLPAPTEFRQKNLGGRTVEEFSDYILKAAPEEWKAATENMTGGLTGGAWNLGLGLKDAADVAVLKSFQDKLSTATKEAMTSGDFDAAYSLVSKGQFFREAYEAATGTGSAGAAFKRGQMGTEGVKPPFPEEKNQASFLPKTESGRALEKQGFEVKPFGQVGIRGVEIFDKNKDRVGEIISSQVKPGEANIANVLVKRPARGQGIGEALYRELGAQLKEDGVTTVTGDVVAPEPLNIRRKVFGEFSDLKVNGKEAPFEDAAAAARLVQKGIEVHHIEPTNRITAESQFLPAEELAVGTAETQPDLKIVPAAAGAGNPPKPPSQFRPPPVAAGVAQRDETPRFLPKADEEIRDLAKTYADGAGLPYAPKGGYAEVKPDLAKRLADFYDAAKSDPTNPEVKASYDALIKETEEQGKAILAAGYKIEPWDKAGEPYKNSAEAIADVRDNKHLFFRKTEGAFAGTADNPMLAESNIVPGQSVNDVFRWVHDFFGHSKEGYQFGPRGEFNAWRAHSEMYSPEAQGALAAETLAQNSWVNFGKHLEGKNIPQAERPFAEQKNIIIPEAFIAEAGFLPKVKRDEQGRPLDKEGNIDYAKWQAEGLAARRKREKEPLAESTPRRPKSPETKLTGWILPNKEFVPLETSFHENYLAENSKDLNKRFGTSFSDTSSVEGRLDALNAGFVRIRFDNGGTAHVEVNASKWTRLKPTVKRLLQDSEAKLSGLVISLLNNKALQVDSATVPRMHELSEPQRLEAIDEALDSLRATSP